MNSFIGTFTRTAEKFADKTALVWYESGHAISKLTFAGLNRDANRMARFLMDRGVAQGDRIILYFNKSLFWVTAHLAIQKAGAVSVPLNPGFKKAEMEYFIRDAAPVLILAEAGQSAKLEGIISEEKILWVDTQRPYENMEFFRSFPNEAPQTKIRLDDPALIIYTSGTTGRPKGAVLNHANLHFDMENIISAWKIAHKDVLCHALPLFHVHGLCFALHTCLTAGSRILLLDAFVPDQVLRLLAASNRDERVTLFMAVPTMYRKLLGFQDDSPQNFPHLRLLTSGSAPLLEKDFHAIETKFGMTPVEREGMSETGMNFSNPLDGPRMPGSIGLPMPGVNVRVVNPATFEDVVPGDIGEFWLKGPAIATGYWRKPEETEAAFHDGWFRTGDLGRMDPDGYYYLTDRIKNIIISGGENISPKEVEAVINRLDGVVESAVIGIEDMDWGEKVVAAVVIKETPEFSIDSLHDWCKSLLHPWKCPKQFLLVKSLPKNTMGKVLNSEIKKLFEEQI